MSNIKMMGWLIGYFIVLSPLFFAMESTLIFGLSWGIIGLWGGIVVWHFG